MLDKLHHVAYEVKQDSGVMRLRKDKEARRTIPMTNMGFQQCYEKGKSLADIGEVMDAIARTG